MPLLDAENLGKRPQGFGIEGRIFKRGRRRLKQAMSRGEGKELLLEKKGSWCGEKGMVAKGLDVNNISENAGRATWVGQEKTFLSDVASVICGTRKDWESMNHVQVW